MSIKKQHKKVFKKKKQRKTDVLNGEKGKKKSRGT